jgi:hypothetical protein
MSCELPVNFSTTAFSTLSITVAWFSSTAVRSFPWASSPLGWAISSRDRSHKVPSKQSAAQDGPVLLALLVVAVVGMEPARLVYSIGKADLGAL